MGSIRKGSGSPATPTGAADNSSIRVQCHWLSKHFSARQIQPRVIRLILGNGLSPPQGVDQTAWSLEVLRQILDFIGPTNAVIVTPGGTIKLPLEKPVSTIPGLEATLDSWSIKFGRLILKTRKLELLLGVDAKDDDYDLQLQTVVHFDPGTSAVSYHNTACKLYPQEDEQKSLIGWRLSKRFEQVPQSLVDNHLRHTKSGLIMALVCHEAVLFSGRSLANVSDPLRLDAQKKFSNALTKTVPSFVTISAHFVDSGTTGGIFLDAMQKIAEASKATVVFSSFAAGSASALDAAAHRFGSIGPHANQVATLVACLELEPRSATIELP
jgi:hypothetical protein